MKGHDDGKAYSDIIHMKRPKSSKRTPMPISDRAAQFAPFAAVVGHEASVKEAARLTDVKRDLDETQKTIIDDQLREIVSKLGNANHVSIIHFQEDDLKSGGAYVETVGKVMKIDLYTNEVCMVEGTRIKIEDIFSIEFKI